MLSAVSCLMHYKGFEATDQEYKVQNYWPTAGEQPNTFKHDKEHSAWYNKISKIVLSKTIYEKGLDNTIVISDQLADNINKITRREK
jgi:hypothetical protein